MIFIFYRNVGDFVTDKNAAIELKGIRKTFGSVVANDSVDLQVRKGEILALLGENGSGKTTLMNMLSGIYKPDSGTIYVNGEQVSIHSPEDSKRLKIGMVHQHFKLVEKFTAADNIILSSEEKEGAFLTKERFSKIKEVSEKFGFDIDPEKHVCDMSVSEKQTVEILKVLYYGAEILILDEPTAVLTLQETRKLFSILRVMRDKGCAIIIITHKLNEVMEISDRVTVLRKGMSVATVNTAETNASELTDLMVGHAVELSIDRPECNPGDVYLELKDVSVLGDEGVLAVNNVSFAVRSGEILGIAGVSGSGQKEICEAVAGLRKLEEGAILCKNEHIEGKTPKQIIAHGVSMSLIPEDRLGMGLAASLSITDNMMLKNYSDGKGPFIDRLKARKEASKIIDELEVVTPGTETPVRRLSGGNVQKVLLGREILAEPDILITAYPVRGLDINSSYTIYNTLNAEKQKGTAVLFVGEDLDVMLELCDRILVLCHGKVTGVVDARTASKEEIGLLMTDAHSSVSLIDEDESGKSISADFTTVSEKKSTSVLKKKDPFIRVVKRDNLKFAQTALLYAISVLAAIVIGGIFVAANGVNPFEYYGKVVVGCFNNAINMRGFIRIVIPLLITSLGIAVAFKMKFWNCGANGQFIAGAVFATTVANLCGNNLPQWLTLILMAAAGILGGGLVGLVPAVCKVKLGTSETLLTLMLNYVCYYTLTYLKNTMFFRKVNEDGSVFRPDFKVLPENAWLYEINIGGLKIDISLFIALLLVVVVYIYFNRTKQGYEISVVGDSKNTARYAGMNVNSIVIRTMFISAGVAGLAGMFQVSGSATSHTLADGITSDVGFTGITVAWLAKLNPIGILIVSALMGILQKGTAVAESTFSNISSAASEILQGIILFAVLAADFFIRYRIVFGKSKNGGEA